MKCSGATAIVRTLERLGVDRAFGIPGIQTIELFDALADATFETVLTTDERSAAFMADAHARITGRLGVVIVVPGPGLTNALTGLAQAKLDSSPVLAIVTSKDAGIRFGHLLHDIDQAALLTPIVKRVVQVDQGRSVTAAVIEAAATAMAGERGPVVLLVAQNLLDEMTDHAEAEIDNSKTAPPDIAMLDRMTKALRSARQVGLYIGRGAAGAADDVRQLAERLAAPVSTTISGRGIVADDHPLCVGVGFGPANARRAMRAFRRVDTLLSIGCKFTEPATGGFGFRMPPRHLHVDINPQSIGRNYVADLALVGDAKEVVTGLLDRLGRTPGVLPPSVPAVTARQSDAVSCSHLLQSLRALLPRDAVVTVDSGSHQFWALAEFPVYQPNTFLAPADFQAMGFAIPAAIAAKRASPDRPVVALVGDGGFLMSGMELMTARRLGLAIVVIVFNDGALGLIRETQQQVHRRSRHTAIAAPDLGAMAAAFGMKYVRIDSDAGVRASLESALDGGFALVDARVRYDERSPYARGAGRTTFGRLPIDRQARLAARRVWRAIRRTQ